MTPYWLCEAAADLGCFYVEHGRDHLPEPAQAIADLLAGYAVNDESLEPRLSALGRNLPSC